ncbi:LysE family translocator [Duganella radicis]|nr:LysE family translocator [Duganella radicis]
MLFAFWVVSISLVMTPGADWAYAISAGMRQRAIGPAVLGMLSGYLLITLVVAAGVGALVSSVPSVLTALTVIGAAYLVWLGVGVLRHPVVPNAAVEEANATWAGWFGRGFLISGINPKALLLFLALLPQFTSVSNSWSIPTQITAMGAVQIINCAVVYSVVGIGSKFILRTRPEAARRVSQFSGIAMIVIAAYLVIGQVMM